MTLAIRISDQANVDVLEIWCTIAEDNPSAADRMVDTLVKAYGLLSLTPDAGRARTELRPGLRSYPVSSYLILYRRSIMQLDILRVIHGSRDLPAIFEQGPIETFRMKPSRKDDTNES